MSTLFNAVNTKNAYTDNGMVTHSTSLSKCVDLFFVAGSARKQDVSPQFLGAFGEDPEVAVRILQWVRDARGGAGERNTFRVLLQKLASQDVDMTRKVIAKIPMLGRWDDVLVLLGNQTYTSQIVQMVHTALKNGDGLCAKWMPRKGENAVILRKSMEMTPRAYRKTLVNLSNTVESQMCSKQFGQIEFGKVPSVAAGRYQAAFKRNAPAEYTAYEAALEKGEAKINAGAVYPYDVTRSLRNGSQAASDAQWKALPNYLEGSDERILPMVDVSGSMGCAASGSVSCMDIAVSLGLYLSERNETIFKDEFLTFSGQPELVKVVGKTLSSRVQQMSTAHWGMNTNLELAFKTILNKARIAGVDQDQMPTTLLVLSDMQFDQSQRGGYYGGESTVMDQTAMEMIRSEYEAAGFQLPKIVFWNLSVQHSGQAPVQFHESGTAMISGFSPAIMTSILGGDDFTPKGIMLNTVMNERYAI